MARKNFQTKDDSQRVLQLHTSKNGVLQDVLAMNIIALVASITANYLNLKAL